MKWLNLAAYKPAAGAGVASTPIGNAFQAIMDAVNGATIAGSPVASAATIPVTNPVHAVTGTVTIANIGDANTPTQGETVTLWIQNGLTIQNNGGGTGNIRTKTGNDRVLVANEIITFMYDGAVWREEGPGIGGAITATKVSQLGTGYEGAQARLRLMPATFNNGGATALPAATLTVGDTTEFPTAGTLDCGANGTVTYTNKTATTFTGCTGGNGTLAANAAIGLASGTPTSGFEDVALIYDSAQGKWVSAVETATSFATPIFTGAGFVEISPTGGNWTGRSGWRKFDFAGLKPQIRWDVLGQHQAAQTVQARASFYAVEGASATPVSNGADAVAVGGVVTAAGVSVSVVTMPPWANLPGGYTLKDVLVPMLQMSVSASSFNVNWTRWFLRWVG